MQTDPFIPSDGGDTYYFFTRGDEAALGRLYKLFFGRLVRYGCRLVPDEFEVSVLVQESFLKLWRHRERIESLNHAWCFLLLVLRWKCKSWHRQQKRRIRCYPGAWLDDTVAAEAPWDPVQERQFAEKLELVSRVLPCLPPKKQTVMKLYFRYGLNCRQIAERFGRSSSAAVARELEESLAHLRTVLRIAKKAAPAAPRRTVLPEAAVGGLSREQETIFRLRYEEGKGFGAIAEKLGLPPELVQQQYVHAWRWIQKQKAKT